MVFLSFSLFTKTATRDQDTGVLGVQNVRNLRRLEFLQSRRAWSPEVVLLSIVVVLVQVQMVPPVRRQVLLVVVEAESAVAEVLSSVQCILVQKLSGLASIVREPRELD